MTPTKAGNRAALWLRVSTPGQTIENQEPDLRRYVEERSLVVVKEYRMQGVSGWKTIPNSRAINAALAEADQYDVLVVWALDRFTRQGPLAALKYVAEFKERGVQVVFLGERHIPPGPIGDGILALTAGMAKAESDRRSDRVKASVVRRQGRFLGGRAYGCHNDGTVNEEQATVIREVAQRVINGEALRCIVRELNASGGKQWNRSTWLTMLRSPRLSGQTVTASGFSFPAIISRGDTRELQRLLAPGNRRKGKQPTTLLTGVLRCGHCGEPMASWTSSSRKGKVYRAYRCTDPHSAGCSTNISGNALDDLVAEAIQSTVMLARAVDYSDEAKELDRQLDEAKQLRTEAFEDYAAKIIDRAQRNRLFTDADAVIADVEAKLAALPRHRVRIEGAWDQLTLEQRRALVADCIETVTIARSSGSRRFEPSRVTITWQPWLEEAGA